MATTKNLIAVTPGGDITDEMIAGEYLWYSIPEAMLSLVTVRRHVKAVGLDVERFPKERRLEHVAQEACRKVEGVYQNGKRTEIRAEMVLRNNVEMVYQITKHVQNKEGRVIDHPKALRVVFDYKRNDLAFEPLVRTKADKEEVEEIASRIREHFDGNASKMPGHKLRTILRHYIEEVGGENVRGRSGGVYFMPKANPQKDGTIIDGRAFAEQIEELLTLLYKTPDMNRVVCINDEGQRAYLKRKFIENYSEDLEEYRENLLDLVSSTKDGSRKRGFRRDKVNNLIAQREAIDERRAKFANILQDELKELDRNMKLADAALKKFLTETETED
jgi:hypothetical protein